MNEQTMALMPLLVTTATIVVAMFVDRRAAQSPVDRRRHHRRHTRSHCSRLVPGWNVTEVHSVAVTNLILVDSTAQFAMALILVTTLGVLTLCPAYFNGYRGHREEMYLLLGVGTLGALTLACASHAATMLLGLELLSLPMVGAVAYAIDRPRSIEGGIKYLILSAGASATLLFGLALIYAETGALDVASLAGAIAGAGLGSPLVTVGAAMLLAGLAFKLSFVPFHQWTPDVYEAAPMPITAYLSTVVKVGAFIVALRLLHAGVGSASPLIVTAIIALALASMLVGSRAGAASDQSEAPARVLVDCELRLPGGGAGVARRRGRARGRRVPRVVSRYVTRRVRRDDAGVEPDEPTRPRRHRRIPRAVVASAVSRRESSSRCCCRSPVFR